MSKRKLDLKEQMGISQGKVFWVKTATGSKGQRCGNNVPWVWQGWGDQGGSL